MVLIGSLYLGALVGEALGIEAWLERVGERLGRAGALAGQGSSTSANSGSTENSTAYSPEDVSDRGSLTGGAPALPNAFTTGLVTAFLIFCVGPMTILGALNEGISGNHELLYVKSGLDLVTSFVLASSFGSGVLFSVIPLAISSWPDRLGCGSAGAERRAVGDLTAVGGARIIGWSEPTGGLQA